MADTQHPDPTDALTASDEWHAMKERAVAEGIAAHWAEREDIVLADEWHEVKERAWMQGAAADWVEREDITSLDERE